MSTFNQKVIVITGGNSGMGKAMAEKFDQEGGRVVLFGRDKKKLDITQKSLNNALAVQGDVCKIADLDRLYHETLAAFGKIDVLIVNAGVAALRHVADVDEAFFDEMVNTNFKGAYFTVQRAVPHFNAAASVILISSMACHFGWHAHSVYSATKAAVSMMARNFAADLLAKGIRVNAISPGYTKTPIFDAAISADPHYVEQVSKNIPMGRFAQPEEIAAAAVFLASPQAGYITGVDLVIDGGMTAFFPG